MLGLMVVVEWEWSHREFSVGWQNHHAEPFPVLPIGSRIVMDEDGLRFQLKVEEIKSWYDTGQKLSVYMLCSVTDEVFQV